MSPNADRRRFPRAALDSPLSNPEAAERRGLELAAELRALVAQGRADVQQLHDMLGR